MRCCLVSNRRVKIFGGSFKRLEFLLLFRFSSLCAFLISSGGSFLIHMLSCKCPSPMHLLFSIPPHFLSSFSCRHGPLLYRRRVVCWGRRRAVRQQGRRSGGYVVGYVAAPARWRYAPPPRHTVVSAAVAACITGEGVGLMTYLYSCHPPSPPPKKEKEKKGISQSGIL